MTKYANFQFKLIYCFKIKKKLGHHLNYSKNFFTHTTLTKNIYLKMYIFLKQLSIFCWDIHTAPAKKEQQKRPKSDEFNIVMSLERSTK